MILFKRLHALWDERNADYMDFNNIRGELEHLFESCLETSTSIQQFNRKVFSFDAQQDKEDTKPVSTIRTTAVYQVMTLTALPVQGLRVTFLTCYCSGVVV